MKEKNISPQIRQELGPVGSWLHQRRKKRTEYIAGKSDLTDKPVAQHIGVAMRRAAMVAPPALITAGSLYVCNSGSLTGELNDLLDSPIIPRLAESAVISGMAMIIMRCGRLDERFIDRFTLHPSRQLGLETEDISPTDIEDDTQYVIRDLNQMTAQGNTEIPQEAEIAGAVHSFFDKLYGQHTNGAKRSKMRHPKVDMGQNSRGRYFGSTGEIVLVDPQDRSAFAHEMIHTRTYMMKVR